MKTNLQTLAILNNAVKKWHEANNNWPYGEQVIIKIFSDDDCPFEGPCLKYKCDLNRKYIRNLEIEGVGIFEFISIINREKTFASNQIIIYIANQYSKFFFNNYHCA